MSFRLPDQLRSILDERAQALGTSRGELARQLVVSSLLDQERQELLDEVKSLRDDVRRLSEAAKGSADQQGRGVVASLDAHMTRLRADLALALESVLLNVADGLSEDEVHSFVSRHLRKGRGGPRA